MKLVTDPEFHISGVVLGGAVAVVSYRWVNEGEFLSRAWDAGVQLADMVGWRAVVEQQSACVDIVASSATGLSVSSAAGTRIAWRTSFDVAVPKQWHEGQMVVAVERA